ncbi:MAG: hypothetical protein J0I34_07435 [Pseudonocardia sp.]|uniref:hypothetical protein n=1 Tax=Actinomycetes TaxID=1760 RepID=UPI000868CACA|nr:MULTISPECIES: hypothetical protein [Actinomycetes]MBN9108600.1 hypothetical protein [Pseudonocardia sp.]ODU27479.1 MAG: hypothetical protein ABS80_03620 [Pseudonocardia sp. SCN 72-51]ODV07759.1 MAG: hypothetical protein ABT15_06700 [Pseudonocardia sp. SCN 73-27]
MSDKPDPDETFVRFTGMKAAAIVEELPTLGGRMRFSGIAECVKEPHHELMADGHHRPVVGMKVIEVELGEVTPAPEGDPQLPYDANTEEIG